MCIRDRSITMTKPKTLDQLRAEKERAETQLAQEKHKLEPVSYTHLDVYKRQPKLFDRMARRFNVDYAFYKTGPDKYLLFFKEMCIRDRLWTAASIVALCRT